MEYTVVPEESVPVAGEYSNPPERISLPTSEYYGQKEYEEPKGKGVKKSLLKTVAAVLSAVTVISASFGIDFLGGGSSPLPIPTGNNFPSLGNLYPDFAGEYAWSEYGSEEYLRVIAPGDSQYTYLVMGGAWESFGNSLGEVEGASYDKRTNTLTLNHCKLDFIDANLMGNGFTIKVIDECYIGGIQIWGAYYGGSLTVTGPGKLYVGEDMTFEGEFSQTCLMVDAELEVYGRIAISATSMEKAIYYSPALKISGGTPASGDFFIYTRGEYDENGNVITVEAPISEIRGEKGERFYDYAVVDDSGNIARHVIFSK